MQQTVSKTAEQIAGQVTKLTSFPDVAFRISDALEDDNSSAGDIGALIEIDPALTAAVLRIANSAMYGAVSSVETVERAVTVMGLHEIRDIVFGVSSATTFKAIPNELISVEDFWKHSLYCAAAAQHLGQQIRCCRGGPNFTAGLLHDIGHLVLFNQCPEKSREALQHSLDNNDGLTPHVSEHKVFGFDHTQVGHALARLWRFPAPLQCAIRDHHHPFGADDVSDIAVLIHLANAIAILAEFDSEEMADGPAIDRRAMEHLGLEADVFIATIPIIQERVPELLQAFVN